MAQHMGCRPASVQGQGRTYSGRERKRNYFEGLYVVITTCAVCAIMSDQDQLQNRAARLLAMALKAREEGHPDYAEQLTQRAAEILDHPTALERLGTKSGEKHPEPKTGHVKEK
jgi:hypothetical protein